MKMIILGGFLGSGKTSVLLQMAKHIVGENPDQPAKVVILENEIGEAAVDDKIINSGGYQVETMFSGCVCCTMSGELIASVSRIIGDMKPDWIIMEATGVAYPSSIRNNIVESLGIECTVCCIADAKRWKRLVLPMEMLLKDQLDSADFILVNKIDTVDEETLRQVDDSIRNFNDTARFYHVSASQGIDETVLQEVLA